VTKKQPELSGQNYLVDTHCHLDMDNYENELAELLERAQTNKVNKIITIGIDLQSSLAAIELARENNYVFPTIGIHPHDVRNCTDSTYHELQTIHDQHKDIIVGYGEIGLDYAKMYSPEKIQKEHFNRQLTLANELDLPVIIHCRDAQEDLLSILKNHVPFKQSGVIHCFSSDMDFAEKVLELGFYISIPGIVSFKNAKDLHEVATNIPLEKMLLETDAPFLAPTPFRGKRNEPSYLIYTADHIAQLRGTTIDKIAKITSQNAETLFNI